MSLGERIKHLRIKENLTQKMLAEKLKIPHQNLSNYERGFRQPDYETLQKIADYFEVSTDHLFGRTSIHSEVSKDSSEFDSLNEINRLLEKYEIDDMSFFDIEKWKSMSPEQIKELESYFQYLVQKSKEIDKN
ncbi:helix-turn-helix domain-containing protein [Halobacillus sp. H74]|uniref:helix-turn-helix domain-containing protein n=1 Tax=Halobacillus sp. H74 TaxID=3457436 RepID=UPI003FCE2A4D